MPKTGGCSGTGLGATLANFATTLASSGVPDDVKELAKLHILDTIGCGVAAASSGLTLKALDYLRLEHAPGPCAVLATQAAFGPAAAAFANAAAMNSLDFDDGFEIAGRGMGHPGASVIAAALSAIWGAPIDGSRFLAAVIAAYEINNRLILSMQPSMPRFRKVYGVCQHQTIGAATAFGCLSGIDARAMENVFGLAATLSNVPSLRKYNWSSRPLISFKDFVAPAAQTGVQAVQLDRSGFVGSAEVFEGEHGYWRMAGSDRFDPAILTGGLGSRWLLRQNSFKPFPACRWIHTALEGFQRLQEALAFSPDEVEEAVVYGSRGIAVDFLDYEPKTAIDAQFSLPYTIAALVQHIPAHQWFDDAPLHDPLLKNLARKVRAVVDPEIDTINRRTRAPAARVSVTLRGRTHDSPLIRLPLGSRERPWPPEAILAKFRANVDAALGSENAAHLAEGLMSLERVSCVATLLRDRISLRGTGSSH